MWVPFSFALNENSSTVFGNKTLIAAGHSMTTRLLGLVKISVQSIPAKSASVCTRYKSRWKNNLNFELVSGYCLTIIKVGETRRWASPKPFANPWTNVVFPLPNSPDKVRTVACPGLVLITSLFETKEYPTFSPKLWVASALVVVISINL